MNRRHALLLAHSALFASNSSAGMLDWYNGVKLGAELPPFDAEYIGSAPPSGYKLLLIDFWASWCGPCREEIPHLNDLTSRFSAQGLSVVGLTQESKAVAQSFLEKFKMAYSVGAGGNRQLQKELGIKALPYAVLVDSQKKIVWRGQSSELSAADVSSKLKSAA